MSRFASAKLARSGVLAALASLAALAGCGADRAPSTSAPAAPVSAAGTGVAAGFDVGPVRTAAEYLAEPGFAAADIGRGELLSLACAACHTLGTGQGTLVGPNLHGVFGRQAGAVSGFAYSPALAASGLVWTPRALDAWLAEPQTFVVGTTMGFTGYRSAEDRRDLIAFLLHATQ